MRLPFIILVSIFILLVIDVSNPACFGNCDHSPFKTLNLSVSNQSIGGVVFEFESGGIVYRYMMAKSERSYVFEYSDYNLGKFLEEGEAERVGIGNMSFLKIHDDLFILGWMCNEKGHILYIYSSPNVTFISKFKNTSCSANFIPTEIELGLTEEQISIRGILAESPFSPYAGVYEAKPPARLSEGVPTGFWIDVSLDRKNISLKELTAPSGYMIYEETIENKLIQIYSKNYSRMKEFLETIDAPIIKEDYEFFKSPALTFLIVVVIFFIISLIYFLETVFF